LYACFVDFWQRVCSFFNEFEFIKSQEENGLLTKIKEEKL